MTAKMTTQQRLDCLLKHFDKLAESQGDWVQLKPKDVTLLSDKCGFSNHNEIAFYVKALEQRGLVLSEIAGDNSIIGAQITIDGYCYLDNIQN